METWPLFFAHVHANLCTVKTVRFWHEAIIQWQLKFSSVNRAVEILISIYSKDLCTATTIQHNIRVNYRGFQIYEVPDHMSIDWLVRLCMFTEYEII